MYGGSMSKSNLPREQETRRYSSEEKTERHQTGSGMVLQERRQNSQQQRRAFKKKNGELNGIQVKALKEMQSGHTKQEETGMQK